MSDFAVSGGALKKLVTLARKTSLSFAFNPGRGSDEHMFGLDKRKAPDLVGRSVKKSGPGAKVAFGTCSVDGKLMTLVCEDPLPTMAKKLKAFLKLNGAPLNVQVLGPDGSVFESDIDDGDGDGTKPATSEETAPVDKPSATAGGAEPADSPLDAGALSQRFKALKLKIEALSNPQRGRLSAAMMQAAALIKGGKLTTAAGLLDKLDQALASVTQSDGDQVQQGAADSKLEKLRLAHARLTELVGAHRDEGVKGKLQQALGKIRQMLHSGDTEASAKGIKSVRTALQKVSRAAQDAAVPEPPPPPPINLAALRSQLKDLANQIMKVDGLDTPEREALVALAQDGSAALKAQDPDKAITHIAELREALQPIPGQIPLTLPIWRHAKDNANEQLDQLQDAMKNSGVPLLERIADVGLNSATESRLVALQVGLLEFDAAADADARSKAEQTLRAAMQNMRSFVETSPILPLLDANPLKVPLKIKATLTNALDEIDRALAV
ncbi:hypothetical protein Q5Y75_23870 [Ruegeria sp. 2205SS24-7]|uniref:hypothetical protein n=1 Tax=Ruegeria discodermiae TaxID=3064389 RepID=UPI002741E3DE|nr:hypothetical protein [Ruegeria sp. 2205SS24-7]MDP5220232.1 hypothetical protein [Ruegeria sp. 2205SS24-7]